MKAAVYLSDISGAFDRMDKNILIDKFNNEVLNRKFEIILLRSYHFLRTELNGLNPYAFATAYQF